MKEYKTMRITEPGWVTDFQYQDGVVLVLSWDLNLNCVEEVFEQSVETTELVLEAARKDPNARVEEKMFPDFRDPSLFNAEF